MEVYVQSDDEGDLIDLECSAAQRQWTPPDGSELEYHYCCFRRSGFSDDLQEIATDRDDISFIFHDDPALSVLLLLNGCDRTVTVHCPHEMDLLAGRGGASGSRIVG